MYRTIRLATCAVLVGLLLSTLVLSLGTNSSGSREGTPYFSALANAGIPSVLAQENSCPQEWCLEVGPPHFGYRCVSVSQMTFCDLGDPNCTDPHPCP
jgi:hypothetical protein